MVSFSHQQDDGVGLVVDPGFQKILVYFTAGATGFRNLFRNRWIDSDGKGEGSARVVQLTKWDGLASSEQ